MFVRLIGVFQVLDDAGRDCTPRGAKSRAILAMLCQTPDRRRPRRWLESKLWSDRGPEQASGSLRQALTELRKALGDAASGLMADRDSVGLEHVATDIETEPETAEEALRSGREFLEGLDVVDTAFKSWLLAERRRVAALLNLEEGQERAATAHNLLDSGQHEERGAPPFVLHYGSLPAGLGLFAARELGQAISRLVAEFLEVEVFGDGGQPVPDGLPAEGLSLHINGVEIRDRFHMMVSLILRGNGQSVWSQRITLDGPQDVVEGLGDVPRLAFEAAEAAMAQMPRLAEAPLAGRACRANALLARAVTLMFTYDAANLSEADSLLQEADDLSHSGSVDAWRSLVRQIMYIERTEGPPDRLMAEADDFARRALERANGKPLVLALVSQTRVMVDTNPDAGSILSESAVRLSPFNAFGYWSAAGADFFDRRFDEALVKARKGAAIASSSAIGHWWEALAGVAALCGGHHAAAVAHCEAAVYRAPNFRAAMRHLIYLYLEVGEPAKASRVLRALLRVEPDFSPDAVLREDYPAINLRRSGLAARHRDEVAAMIKRLRG